MKQLFAILVISLVSVFSMADDSAMQMVVDSQHGGFYAGALPMGFSAVSIDLENSVTPDGRKILPYMTADLKKTLAELEAIERLRWQDYVMAAPYEFVDCPSDLSDEACAKQFEQELVTIGSNPESYMGRPILEGRVLNLIYKGEEMIGFVYEFANNVDASIIQDGSGLVIYVSTKGKVLYLTDWQA